MKYFLLFWSILCLGHSYYFKDWDPKTHECPSFVDECNPIELGYDGNAKEDAIKIHEAFKNPEEKVENVLIDVISRRNLAQRLELVEAYNSEFKTGDQSPRRLKSFSGRIRQINPFTKSSRKDLLDDLGKTLSGQFRNLVLAMLMPLDDFYAREIHNSINMFDSKSDSLIEILGSLSNKGMLAVVHSYVKMYGRGVRKDLETKFFDSKYFNKLCISLTLGRREKGDSLDNELVEADIHALPIAETEGDEATFEDFLYHRNFPHILKVMNEVSPILGKCKGISKSLREATMSIHNIARNRKLYFARRIKKATDNSWQTNDLTLTRIIVGRSEIDLKSIVQSFNSVIGIRGNLTKILADAIGLSNTYKDLIFRFLGEN